MRTSELQRAPGAPRRPAFKARLWAAAALVAALCSSGARAQGADPWKDWSTADSPHFRVHFRSTQRAQAESVARAAERVYPQITQALNWEPRGLTEIVIYTEFDQANGFSTPLPFNTIGVFLAPPDEGELLENSAWLDLLLVHEFTHTVHLDKVRGAPRVLQVIFGREPWFMPNLFQPGWGTEGLAVFNESDPARGRGRLQGPWFEGWLRAEQSRGFISLSELNARGRALPLSKDYLYGAYFFEFLTRRYGPEQVKLWVERYSGNIVPRLASNAEEGTGKDLRDLWLEFLQDLGQQVDARAKALRAQPEVLGQRMLGPLFDIPSVVALPKGELLTVLNDGLSPARLVRLRPDGSRSELMRVNSGARLTASADGQVLLTQPDVCDGRYLGYDVYRLSGDRLDQLTSCAHLRRAVPAGNAIVALRLNEGRIELVRLDGDGKNIQLIHRPAADTDLIDLAASPDGRRVAVIAKRAARWQLLEFDLAQLAGAPKVLLTRAAPMSALRQGREGLEWIAADGGVLNVWRLKDGRMQRLTHSHTAVVAHSGSAEDGTLATVVMAPQGYALHRLAAPAALDTVAADAGEPAKPEPAMATAAAGSASIVDAAGNEGVLGESRRYNALRSVYPRAWLPAVTSDRGLTAFGASTFGSDALGWHQYVAQVQWETSQKEVLADISYVFIDEHSLSLSRSLRARAWTGSSGKEKTTLYDRNTKVQWLSLLPFDSLQQSLTFGVGAALDRIDRIRVDVEDQTRLKESRIVAGLVDFDSRTGNWRSEGNDRGLRATLLYETYRPLSRKDSTVSYDGAVLRTELQGLLPIGPTVLALRVSNAHATGRTEPFQLGGATDTVVQVGYTLNNRDLALRGYRGSEPELRGQNARLASLEWRTPLADIDRHAMVPPIGIDRLSAAVFIDAGGAWSVGSKPDRWRKGVGFELLGEVKLLYALGVQLRVGVARGLDAPAGTVGYAALGRSF